MNLSQLPMAQARSDGSNRWFMSAAVSGLEPQF